LTKDGQTVSAGVKRRHERDGMWSWLFRVVDHDAFGQV